MLYKIIVMLFFYVSRKKHLDYVISRDRLVVIQQRAPCSSFLINKGAVHTGSAHRCSVHRSGVYRSSVHRSGVQGTVYTGTVCTGVVCTEVACTEAVCTGAKCTGAVHTGAMCFRITGTGEYLHMHYLLITFL